MNQTSEIDQPKWLGEVITYTFRAGNCEGLSLRVE